jgi:hypothetical protein
MVPRLFLEKHLADRHLTKLVFEWHNYGFSLFVNILFQYFVDQGPVS